MEETFVLRFLFALTEECNLYPMLYVPHGISSCTSTKSARERREKIEKIGQTDICKMHVNCKQKTRFGAIFGTLPTIKKTTSITTNNQSHLYRTSRQHHQLLYILHRFSTLHRVQIVNWTDVTTMKSHDIQISWKIDEKKLVWCNLPRKTHSKIKFV